MSENQEAPDPDIVNQAYDILLQHRIVEITRHLDWDPKRKGWTFECVVSVPHPNQEGIPSKVPLLVLIREAFPLAPVEFFPLCDEVSGFPHQDAESNKLCLEEEYSAPRNVERLTCYVNWAKDWLVDAANGTLFKPGDPYELPAFTLGDSLPINKLLMFNETEESYERWKQHIGESGLVRCTPGNGISALFAVRFCDNNNSVIQESRFSSTVLTAGIAIVGRWFILRDICYMRHRPPRTFGEMEELFSGSNIDFYNILKSAWRFENHNLEVGLVLVGFPIPKLCGEKPVEIHWQPLLFPNLRAEQSKRKNKGKLIKSFKVWEDGRRGCFSAEASLPWGLSTNIAHNRLYARGSCSPTLQSAHIAIFGCGALGSIVAELLVRGGVTNLALFDRDVIQIGNLCRHTLDGSHLRAYKAKALATRLSGTNPLSTINGFSLEIPLTLSSPQDARNAISEADLLIDCTTSESAFEWLDGFAMAEDRRLITIFFSFHAEFLTLCISGETTSCGEVFQDFLGCVRDGQLPVTPDVYLYQPRKQEQIIPGAGCWHPTFPALNAHIHQLAASAVDIIDRYYEQEEKKGLAVLIRRNALTEFHSGSLVEVVWTKQYP